MKAAIYSRKSKFTGKGDSVENQIQMCKEHAMKFFNCCEEDFIVYEDEGFSGGNTDRPRFQQMLKDARKKMFDAIICYRLDRVSRNVSDFSQLIDKLEKWGVGFISVKEQFDTTKPMGRAMMYIASVFSQLERETIAERIKDNMLQLSKTGRWLGGTTPTGYKSEMVSGREANGREVRCFKLVEIPEETQLVKLLFDKYIELKSITRVEKYLAKNNIYTKNGAVFGRFSIRFILSNPVYVIADQTLYSYLTENKYDVYSGQEEFNGINGLIGYNRTKQSSSTPGEKYRESHEWILAVGLHTGIISSSVWIEAQELLKRNKTKAYRRVRSNTALLSGLIRCAGCGSLMRPKAGRKPPSNAEQAYYYICELKEKSNREQCSMANVNGKIIDEMVLSELRKLFQKYPPIIEAECLADLKNWFSSDSRKDELHLLEEKLFNTDYEIKNLIRVLSRETDTELEAALTEQIRSLSSQKQSYISSIESLLLNNPDYNSSQSQEAFLNNIYPPDMLNWNKINIESKRNIIKAIIKKLEWNGESIELFLNSAQ